MNGTYEDYTVKCANLTCNIREDSEDMDKNGLCEACRRWLEESGV